MSTSFIDEYLVKLSASVDQSGMQRFYQALREASAVSSSSAASIAGSFFKVQTELTAGFLAIGGAAVGLVDKVAMADQSYRLFALHMYMSKDAARGLKIAMDALGEPLENLTWDKELRGRTHQLIEDQRAMSPDGDFEAQMRKIRDIRFEFTRMEVEGQYLAMHVVENFMQALGIGPDELLGKLRQFNDWVTHNLPEISNTIVTDFMPVWKDMEHIAVLIDRGVYEAADAFQFLVGILSSDSALTGSTVTFETMAKTLEHVANAAAKVLEFMIALETGGIKAAKAALLAMRGYTDKALGDDKDGNKYVKAAGKEWWSIGDLDSFGDAVGSKPGKIGIHSLIDKYAVQMGVDPALAHAVAMHESGEREYDNHGKLLRNPGSTATGVFQLLNGTAATLGVDSSDAEGNVKGGVKLLRQMLTRYLGNVPEAIGAFQFGAGKMDEILARKATMVDTPQRHDAENIASVLRAMGQHGDVHVGDIIVHIDRPNATNQDVAAVVAARIKSLRDKQVQRNLSETAPWGYTGTGG